MIQLEIVRACREDLVQQAVGATLLEVLPYETTILRVVPDGSWG
jgi:hypothetical protein